MRMFIWAPNKRQQRRRRRTNGNGDDCVDDEKEMGWKFKQQQNCFYCFYYHSFSVLIRIFLIVRIFLPFNCNMRSTVHGWAWKSKRVLAWSSSFLFPSFFSFIHPLCINDMRSTHTMKTHRFTGINWKRQHKIMCPVSLGKSNTQRENAYDCLMCVVGCYFLNAKYARLYRAGFGGKEQIHALHLTSIFIGNAAEESTVGR